MQYNIYTRTTAGRFLKQQMQEIFDTQQRRQCGAAPVAAAALTSGNAEATAELLESGRWLDGLSQSLSGVQCVPSQPQLHRSL